MREISTDLQSSAGLVLYRYVFVFTADNAATPVSFSVIGNNREI